jgi:hypothetical protein
MHARRKLGEARKLIQKGCELCPGAEDVWLEAARLQTPDHAKALLARGVAANPTSIKLWLQVGFDVFSLIGGIMLPSRFAREQVPGFRCSLLGL